MDKFINNRFDSEAKSNTEVFVLKGKEQNNILKKNLKTRIDGGSRISQGQGKNLPKTAWK